MQPLLGGVQAWAFTWRRLLGFLAAFALAAFPVGHLRASFHRPFELVLGVHQERGRFPGVFSGHALVPRFDSTGHSLEEVVALVVDLENFETSKGYS
jgi:hypothetical protein